MDTLIAVLFVVFLGLVGWRAKQGWSGRRAEPAGGVPVRERLRRWWGVLQVVVLAGLAVWVVPLLWQDFHHLDNRDLLPVLLRCLIFLCAIYILIVRLKGMAGRGFQEKE